MVERYGYAGVAGAVSLEGFGIPAPGQSLLMAGALESAKGHMHLALLLPIAVLAAVLGNSLGYLIGRRGGRPLLRRLGVNEAQEAKLAGLFDRCGGGLILMARFFDGPRQLNGILAGTLAMPWWLFTLLNVIRAVLWVGLWGLGTSPLLPGSSAGVSGHCSGGAWPGSPSRPHVTLERLPLLPRWRVRARRTREGCCPVSGAWEPAGPALGLSMSQGVQALITPR